MVSVTDIRGPITRDLLEMAGKVVDGSSNWRGACLVWEDQNGEIRIDVAGLDPLRMISLLELTKQQMIQELMSDGVVDGAS